MEEVLISAQNIIKEFKNSGNKNKVINNITLDIYNGDFTVIMEKSGAGKSILLYALSDMNKITSGKILYKGKEYKINKKYDEKNSVRINLNEELKTFEISIPLSARENEEEYILKVIRRVFKNNTEVILQDRLP